MIEEQLFDRVIKTLKDNNDTVVVGIADTAGDEFRVYYSGSDDMITRVIEGISDVYINELINDIKTGGKNAPDPKAIDLDKFLKDLEDGLDGKN